MFFFEFWILKPNRNEIRKSASSNLFVSMGWILWCACFQCRTKIEEGMFFKIRFQNRKKNKFENLLWPSYSSWQYECIGVLDLDVELKLKKYWQKLFGIVQSEKHVFFRILDFKAEQKWNSKIGFLHLVRLDETNSIDVLDLDVDLKLKEKYWKNFVDRRTVG